MAPASRKVWDERNFGQPTRPHAIKGPSRRRPFVGARNPEGKIVLGDEFSPDGCRIWDKETRKKMDKDRFRQGLGEVIETYEEVGRRLGIKFD